MEDRKNDLNMSVEEFKNSYQNIIRKRLEMGWTLILDQYKNFALNTSRNGPGINFFEMSLPTIGEKRTSTDAPNCEYYYAEKDSVPWNDILAEVPRKKDLLEAYSPDSGFLMCVSVPMYDVGDERLQSIRLFEFDTGKEINY